jgi:hypothetical protein
MPKTSERLMYKSEVILKGIDPLPTSIEMDRAENQGLELTIL